MPGPILETADDLVLRTVEREDAEFLQRLFTDPYARLGFHEHSHKSENELEEFIEEEVEGDGNAAYLACVDEADAPWEHPDEDDTTPVSFVFASHVDRDRPRLVLWVPPEHRGEGHGAAALELALKGLFRTYDAHSVGAEVLDGDDPTRAAFENAGFTDEGSGRELAFVDGEYRDATQYGLLREEWEDE
ncbi:GNAT family N-acetyltransferase [Halobacterium zhouii]|uniref:GNAT family N-acetyltransferase n=1 Tax=Halobacterium zhouii TaxID=2902624 RepID=UPI001E2F983E|nr:GNAT family protein [Halobacterium zhouii]